jgi:hypothetical protein
MTSSDGGSTSSQASTSSLIRSMYNHYNHVVSTTNPAKVIKQFGLFKFEEDLDVTPWHVSSPLNLALATTPFPKFKDHLPKFSRNGIVSGNQNLIAFSNACHNIRGNYNDVCMHLFVKSLEGKDATCFFELPPKLFSTCAELSYWFKSTYGQRQSPTYKLKYYNNIVYNKGETIKYFNLCFTKL